MFTTFEGDNTVLMQLVAKSLLTGYRQQFEDDRVFTVMKLIVERASGALTDRNPFQVRRTGSEHLRDGDFQLRALRFRESDLLASAAGGCASGWARGWTRSRRSTRCRTT